MKAGKKVLSFDTERFGVSTGAVQGMEGFYRSGGQTDLVRRKES